MINGIDVSKWQAKIDWSKVGKTDNKFVFMKVTDGTDYKDPTFAYNWSGALSNGLYRGAYHYVRGTDTKKQVDNLLYTLNNDFGELPIALDAEDRTGDIIGKTLEMSHEISRRLPNQKSDIKFLGCDVFH